MYLKMERFLFNNHYPTSSNIIQHHPTSVYITTKKVKVTMEWK